MTVAAPKGRSRFSVTNLAGKQWDIGGVLVTIGAHEPPQGLKFRTLVSET